jgi:hypothetical protein
VLAGGSPSANAALNKINPAAGAHRQTDRRDAIVGR